jgi:hypothetical protein
MECLELSARTRAEREQFHRKLKEEWRLLWGERFDDKVRAEGIAVRDYPLLFADRGVVIFASRGANALGFSEIVEFWTSRGFVYAPDPSEGGWGKFGRTEVRKLDRWRAKKFEDNQPKCRRERRQLKKGGRGWLHIE